MIPMLPTSTHLDFARELAKYPTREQPVTPDDLDYIASRQFDLAPDPVYISLSRLWTRLTNRFHGASQRPA